MRSFSREEVLSHLLRKKNNHEPIIAGGAGMGLVAKMEEKAGIDLIIAYNSGSYRVNGHPSCMGILPFGNANSITMQLGNKLMGVINKTPVIAGIGAADPYLSLENYIDEMIIRGFSGFINFPTNGSYVGWFRERVDSAGVGFNIEVDLVSICHRKNYFSIAYAYTNEEIIKMIDAGADIIVLHMGATSGGTVGWQGAMSIEEACEKAERLYEVAKTHNPKGIYLIHGGPFKDPFSVQACFDRVSVDGFVGASSMERLPIEAAITDVISQYKSLKLR